MLKDVLNLFLDKKCNNLVITNDIEDRITKELKDYINNNFSVSKIEDVRSATFFALGNADVLNNTILLMVDGEYLPNIYTGITEAWFQKKNIIVIALYNEYDNINCEYLRNCIPNIINLYGNEISKYKNKIEQSINKSYCSLINIKYDDMNKQYNDYTKLCETLNKILTKTDEVFLYNSDIQKKYNYEIKNILKEYKYGIVSKYMAYTISKQKKIILCCPADILNIDLNIFNNRYIDKNIKIILINDKNTIKTDRIEEWIQTNKVNVSIEQNIDEKKIKEFIESDRPEVMFIGGEQ